MRNLFAVQQPDTAQLSVHRQQEIFIDGFFLESDVKDQSGRVYPAAELTKAVAEFSDRIRESGGVPGVADHSADDLNTNIARISHLVTDVQMRDGRAMAKLKILESMPVGKLIRNLVDAGIRLGLSVRGRGNVNESTGEVADLEIAGIDLVVSPPAPQAV